MNDSSLVDYSAISSADGDTSLSKKKQTKAENAYQALRRRIMTSELPAGAAVSERSLAEMLGTGKAPVRVAIQRLATEGFLAIESRRGIRVTQHSVQDVLDLFQVRVVMEQLVVRKIAGTLRPPQIARLEQNLQAYKKAASIPDIDAMIMTDFAFHQLLAEFHGNKQLAAMLERTLDSLYREIRNTMKVQRRTAERLAEHQRIVDALVEGDTEAAEYSLISHLESGQRFVMSGGDAAAVSEV